ncbi:hypothetical protein E2562_013963 [Oryza meyeriana var. granulata]|uniref:Uncharacterized protein n=1 Tax=Oryza meyeriana var. granulata TaxID=110450 RepID=A0A6G1DJ95_9ORYZ|nr:hypothetical protein E2562_013963 [Oryza meyeriana var. granulata]
MREAILHVRRGRSVLAPDDPASPYREPRPAAVSKAGKPSPGPGPVTRSQGRLLQGQQQQGLAAGVALQGQQVLAATVASKLRWVRSAATGTLWATPGGDLADVERTREEFLSLSQARSILAPYLEQKNISYLSTLRKNIVLDPIKYQASVPEWENAPSEKDIADYKSDD